MVHECYLDLKKEDSQKYFNESVTAVYGFAYLRRKDYVKGIHDQGTGLWWRKRGGWTWPLPKCVTRKGNNTLTQNNKQLNTKTSPTTKQTKKQQKRSTLIPKVAPE